MVWATQVDRQKVPLLPSSTPRERHPLGSDLTFSGFSVLALILLPPGSVINPIQEASDYGSSVKDPVRGRSLPYHKQG